MSTIDLQQLAGAPTAQPTALAPPPRRWRSRVLIPAVVLAATAGIFAYALRDAVRPTLAVQAVPVIEKRGADGVGQAARGAVVAQAPGWIEPDPFLIHVAALADGVVADVLVLEGATVASGQVVARLVDDDARLALERAKATVGELDASLQAAHARLQEAQHNWSHPIELTRKRETARAALAERRAELDRWPAELQREQARAVFLKAEFDRVRPLHERGVTSDIELVQAEQDYLAQAAAVEVMRRREAILKAQIRQLEAEVAAAQEDFERRIADTRALAGAKAAVAAAEAALAEAQAARDETALRLERMQVRSPVDGVVMQRLVAPGSKVMMMMDSPHSNHVLHLYDPNHLQVRVDVPLVDAAKVGVGQRAEVIADVLPGRTFTGRVTRVVHEADIQKNTLQVKVAIDAPARELKPEMLARVRFFGRGDGAPAIAAAASAERPFAPRAAIQSPESDPFVWKIDRVAGVARRVAVELGGAAQDDWVHIRSGLQPGDRVITSPPSAMRDGVRVREDDA